MNYFNQKEIYNNSAEINKIWSRDNDKDFLHSLRWEQLVLVTSELNGNEFKIWLYLMKFNGITNASFYYSPAALEQYFNISESTAQRGFKTLVSLNYLRKNDNNKGYTFYPLGNHSM